MTDDDLLKIFDGPDNNHVTGLFGKCSCGDDHNAPRGFVAEMVTENVPAARKVKMDSSLRMNLRRLSAAADPMKPKI